MLDGTGSYDPDSAGPLTFRWTAAAPTDGGAPAAITNASRRSPR